MSVALWQQGGRHRLLLSVAHAPPSREGEGGGGQKKVCVPEIDLHFGASLINFVFPPRKVFLMWVGGWVGRSAGAGQGPRGGGGHSRQNAAPHCSMRREERVTDQDPVKKQGGPGGAPLTQVAWNRPGGTMPLNKNTTYR